MGPNLDIRQLFDVYIEKVKKIIYPMDISKKITEDLNLHFHPHKKAHAKMWYIESQNQST
jgi:hypothetical protein